MTDSTYQFVDLTLSQFADLAVEIDHARELLVTDGSLCAALLRGALAEIADRIESLVATARELREATPESAPAASSSGARHAHGCAHLPPNSDAMAPRYLVKADDGSGVLLCAACALAAVTAWHLPQQPQDKTTLACPHAMEGAPIWPYTAAGQHTLLQCGDCAIAMHSQLHRYGIGIRTQAEREEANDG